MYALRQQDSLNSMIHRTHDSLLSFLSSIEVCPLVVRQINQKNLSRGASPAGLKPHITPHKQQQLKLLLHLNLMTQIRQFSLRFHIHFIIPRTCRYVHIQGLDDASQQLIRRMGEYVIFEKATYLYHWTTFEASCCIRLRLMSASPQPLSVF